jgi:hypothetical protein
MDNPEKSGNIGYTRRRNTKQKYNSINLDSIYKFYKKDLRGGHRALLCWIFVCTPSATMKR